MPHTIYKGYLYDYGDSSGSGKKELPQPDRRPEELASDA
jgi:hypothetical protein